jgi:hypothetical protein
MNIIKEGIDAVELLRRELLGTKTFECKVCGCVFEADKDEYKYVHTEYTCACPNCHEEVNANSN